jgi:hypothetical protein
VPRSECSAHLQSGESWKLQGKAKVALYDAKQSNSQGASLTVSQSSYLFYIPSFYYCYYLIVMFSYIRIISSLSLLIYDIAVNSSDATFLLLLHAHSHSFFSLATFLTLATFTWPVSYKKPDFLNPGDHWTNAFGTPSLWVVSRNNCKNKYFPSLKKELNSQFSFSIFCFFIWNILLFYLFSVAVYKLIVILSCVQNINHPWLKSIVLNKMQSLLFVVLLNA